MRRFKRVYVKESFQYFTHYMDDSFCGIVEKNETSIIKCHLYILLFVLMKWEMCDRVKWTVGRKKCCWKSLQFIICHTKIVVIYHNIVPYFSFNKTYILFGRFYIIFWGWGGGRWIGRDSVLFNFFQLDFTISLFGF